MNLTNLEKYISSDRLSSYFSLTGTSDIEKSICAYHWNKALGGAIYPILQCLEVTLRNSIHIEAWNKFSKETWYEPLCKSVGSKIRAKQKKQGNTPKNTANENKLNEAISKLKANNKVVSASNIVASLTLGFWVNLLKNDYMSGDQTLLWPELIPKVFPNIPKPYNLRTIYSDLKEINQLRNRFSHHEPLWKSTSIQNISGAVFFLDKQVETILNYIRFVNVDRYKTILSSSMYHDLRFLNTEEAFNLFIGNFNGVITRAKFKSNLSMYIKRINNKKKPIYIRCNDNIMKLASFDNGATLL